jgi:hypothetical protein
MLRTQLLVVQPDRSIQGVLNLPRAPAGTRRGSLFPAFTTGATAGWRVHSMDERPNRDARQRWWDAPPSRTSLAVTVAVCAGLWAALMVVGVLLGA